jgi:exo-beta-1,3-glucanase (GH17 family)
MTIFLFHGAFDWYSNQPQDVGTDVPSGKLNSLSFAPFREGVSPLKEEEPLVEHIDEDLKLLADKTHSIRTYSSLGGLQPTPDLARKYGLTMIQGAWLGDENLKNQKEIKALVESANANPDVVKRVIVGNEVLLRGEQPVDRLIEYIREVKRQVKQPVSYADVWSMYMKHPQLIKEVDFITIHILPYWEDEPISVEHAGEHLEKIVRQVENEARGVAPGKPILIGESGWPSAGRQRGMAIPGVANEAKFIRDMIQVAKQHGFDYNIVEAFNQPWKSNLEGVVGANWGLLSADREPVFPLTGKVYENPDWMMHFAVSTVLWLLVVVRYFRVLQRLSLSRAIVFLAIAQLFSVCLVELGDFLWYTSYSGFQRSYTLFIVLANALLAGMLVQRNIDVLDSVAGNQGTAVRLRNLYLIFIALALYKTFGLAFNGRYLSFPVEQFAIPAFGIIGMIVCQWLSLGHLKMAAVCFNRLSGWDLHSRRDRTVAYLLIFAMMGLVLGETRAFLVGRDFILAHPGLVEGLPVALGYTLKNQQLVLWLACLLVLSVPFWRNDGGKLPR